MAAVLACGKGAALTCLSAAELRGTSRWPIGPISVLTRTAHKPAGIDVHRCNRLDPRDVTTFNGIPVTTVARMLVDLSATMTPHQLAWIIHEALHRKCFNLAATRRAMARADGRRGLKNLERAIELHLSGSAGTRSAAEDAYLETLEDTDVVFVNTTVEVDILRPDGSVVEIDGPGHERPATRREDAERDARLERAGFTVQRLPLRRPQAG